MKRIVRLSAAMAGLILTVSLCGGDAWGGCPGPCGLLQGLFGPKACSGDCPARWCPDDYCPKPAPCVCLPPTRGCSDCYCPKPAPCVCFSTTCGTCDDYCPKPAPCVKTPCGWPAWYKCPPPLRPCGPCTGE